MFHNITLASFWRPETNDSEAHYSSSTNVQEREDEGLKQDIVHREGGKEQVWKNREGELVGGVEEAGPKPDTPISWWMLVCSVRYGTQDRKEDWCMIKAFGKQEWR